MHECIRNLIRDSEQHIKGDWFETHRFTYSPDQYQEFFKVLFIVTSIYRVEDLDMYSKNSLDKADIMTVLEGVRSPYAYLYDRNMRLDDEIIGTNTCLAQMQGTLLRAALDKDITVQNYVISKNLCNVLQGVPTPNGAYEMIMDYLGDEAILSMKLNLFDSPMFRDITFYVHKRNHRLCYMIFGILKGSNVFLPIATQVKNKTKSDNGKDEDLHVICYPLLEWDVRDLFGSPELDKDVHLLNHILVNILLYISSPSKSSKAQQKIAEFSSKKGKREYEKKHYSSEPWTELNISVPNVRAYEQGKSWDRRAHTRWQPCGEGRSKLKLVFIGPQKPQRRKLF